MPTDWKKIAKETGEATDEHFKDQISGLTRLTNNEIESLITDTGISKTDLTSVLKEVEDATKSNEEKAAAISNINKGVGLLVGIAKKIIL
jgi:hypothetical protein